MIAFMTILSAIAAAGAVQASRALTIGTRGSPLALAQASETKKLIEMHFPAVKVNIQEIMTTVWTSIISVLKIC